MTINILRTQDGKTYQEEFSLGHSKVTTLLSALYEIKSKLDPTLTFGSGCRSGICGSCAVLVDGKETLACSHKPSADELIEPLRYHPVIRDLKVDKSKAHATLSILKSVDLSPDPKKIDEQKTKIQTDCILCDSCYSACPVLAVNSDFLGPFTLTRVYRYEAIQSSNLLESIQTNGIWDCTLCGECTIACPQGIDSKMDITMLRSLSAQAGHSDPNFGAMGTMEAMDFGTPDFGDGGFGF